MLPGGIVLETSCVSAPVKDLLRGMYLNQPLVWMVFKNKNLQTPQMFAGSN